MRKLRNYLRNKCVQIQLSFLSLTICCKFYFFRETLRCSCHCYIMGKKRQHNFPQNAGSSKRIKARSSMNDGHASAGPESDLENGTITVRDFLPPVTRNQEAAPVTRSVKSEILPARNEGEEIENSAPNLPIWLEPENGSRPPIDNALISETPTLVESDQIQPSIGSQNSEIPSLVFESPPLAHEQERETQENAVENGIGRNRFNLPIQHNGNREPVDANSEPPILAYETPPPTSPAGQMEPLLNDIDNGITMNRIVNPVSENRNPPPRIGPLPSQNRPLAINLGLVPHMSSSAAEDEGPQASLGIEMWGLNDTSFYGPLCSSAAEEDESPQASLAMEMWGLNGTSFYQDEPELSTVNTRMSYFLEWLQWFHLHRFLLRRF